MSFEDDVYNATKKAGKQFSTLTGGTKWGAARTALPFVGVGVDALKSKDKNAYLDDPNVPFLDKAKVTLRDGAAYGLGTLGTVVGAAGGRGGGSMAGATGLGTLGFMGGDWLADKAIQTFGGGDTNEAITLHAQQQANGSPGIPKRGSSISPKPANAQTIDLSQPTGPTYNIDPANRQPDDLKNAIRSSIQAGLSKARGTVGVDQPGQQPEPVGKVTKTFKPMSVATDGEFDDMRRIVAEGQSKGLGAQRTLGRDENGVYHPDRDTAEGKYYRDMANALADQEYMRSKGFASGSEVPERKVTLNKSARDLVGSGQAQGMVGGVAEPTFSTMPNKRNYPDPLMEAVNEAVAVKAKDRALANDLTRAQIEHFQAQTANEKTKGVWEKEIKLAEVGDKRNKEFMDSLQTAPIMNTDKDGKVSFVKDDAGTQKLQNAAKKIIGTGNVGAVQYMNPTQQAELGTKLKTLYDATQPFNIEAQKRNGVIGDDISRGFARGKTSWKDDILVKNGVGFGNWLQSAIDPRYSDQTVAPVVGYDNEGKQITGQRMLMRDYLTSNGGSSWSRLNTVNQSLDDQITTLRNKARTINGGQ